MRRLAVTVALAMFAFLPAACDSPTEPEPATRLAGSWQASLRNYAGGEDWSLVVLRLGQDGVELAGELETRDGVKRRVSGRAPLAGRPDSGYLEILDLPGTTGSCLSLSMSIESLDAFRFGGVIAGRCPGTVADPYVFRRR